MRGGMSTEISNEFLGYYFGNVQIYEKDGKLYVKKEIIDSPEYQDVLKARAGRAVNSGFSGLGVSLEGVLSELETKESDANQKGSEGEVEITKIDDLIYDNRNALGLSDSKKILVLCAGYGTLLDYIKDRLDCADTHPKITAVDINPEAIKTSRQKHPDVEHLEGNIGSMPFPAGSFDIVIADIAFSSLVWPRTGIRETSRVLRHNGFLLARELYIDNEYIEKAVQEEGLRLVLSRSDGIEYGLPAYSIIGQKK